MGSLEFAEYEKYAVTLRDRPDAIYRAQLLAIADDEAEARAFVEAYAPAIKGDSLDVAATYSASWIGRLCAAFHYAMWRDGVELNCSLADVTLSIHDDNGHAALSFHLNDAGFASLPANGTDERIAEATAAFYRNHIRPLFESIARAAGINVGALWGQLATRMHYLRGTWDSEADTEERQQRLARVTALLFGELPGACFGRKRNPFDLKFRMVDDPKQPGAKMRLKATCCLAYKLNTGYGHCYTCPRLTDEEREVVRRSKFASV